MITHIHKNIKLGTYEKYIRHQMRQFCGLKNQKKKHVSIFWTPQIDLNHNQTITNKYQKYCFYVIVLYSPLIISMLKSCGRVYNQLFYFLNLLRNRDVQISNILKFCKPHFCFETPETGIFSLEEAMKYCDE